MISRNHLIIFFSFSFIVSETYGQEFKCPDDFGFYPHHLSCDKYWKCDNNLAELKTCGNGLAFDATDSKFLTENCDYLHNVECGERTQLEPPISTPHCTRLYGIFPDEKKCDVFWNCWNGEASRYQCSPGLAYDRDARVCMWADQVPECRNEGKRDTSQEMKWESLNSAMWKNTLTEKYHWNGPINYCIHINDFTTLAILIKS